MATKKVLTPSQKFYAKEYKLKYEVIDKLREMVGKKTFDLVELESEFTDESNNELVKIDKEGVYFNEGEDFYGLSELGTNDAIYLISILEDL